MADQDKLPDSAPDDGSTLRAVTDTINQLTGSLTGRNLEQKIQEYTSVYGEILLGMHNRLNDLERETKALRKETAQQYRRIGQLEKRLTDDRNGRSHTDRFLLIASLLLSVTTFLWLLWTHTRG